MPTNIRPIRPDFLPISTPFRKKPNQHRDSLVPALQPNFIETGWSSER